MEQLFIINKEPARLEMTITKVMEAEFKGPPMFLEVEMLQGFRNELPDGRIYYQIEIFDDFKAELMQEFCLKTISQSYNSCKS